MLEIDRPTEMAAPDRQRFTIGREATIVAVDDRAPEIVTDSPPFTLSVLEIVEREDLIDLTTLEVV